MMIEKYDISDEENDMFSEKFCKSKLFPEEGSPVTTKQKCKNGMIAVAVAGGVTVVAAIGLIIHFRGGRNKS